MVTGVTGLQCRI